MTGPDRKGRKGWHSLRARFKLPGLQGPTLSSPMFTGVKNGAMHRIGTSASPHGT
jgi:hypothetical protein